MRRLQLTWLASLACLVGCLITVSCGQRVGQQTNRPERNANTPNNQNLAKPGAKRNKLFEVECLAAHNKWRRLHNAPDLVFDRKIASFSQKRADFIAASDGDEFKHPKDLVYGENLAWHSRSSKNCDELIRMWYDEIDIYDWDRATFDHETGHFTQLIWRSTERVGCARAFSSGPKGGIYLVCNYDPPGNYLGEERDNVFPRLDWTKVPAGNGTAPAPVTSSVRPSISSNTGVTLTSTSVAPSTRAPSSTSSTSRPTTKPKKNKDKKKRRKNKKKKKKGNKKKRKNTTTSTSTSTTTSTSRPGPQASSAPAGNVSG